MAKKRHDYIEQLINQMNSRIENYRNSPEDELALLQYLKQFYKYSTRNAMLIESQYQGAYGVASYKQHQENGYQVQKGQKAIRILAPRLQDVFIDENGKEKPVKYAKKEEKAKIKQGQLQVKKNKLVGYIPVPVFDITQTDCPPEEYPKLYPNRPENFRFDGTEQDFNIFYQSIKDYAKDKDIPVSLKAMDGVHKGYYVPATNEIALRDTLTEREQVKTLLHELAHSEMHNKDIMKNKAKELQSTNIIEYQAEMVAYLVSSTFELDTENYSTKYMKNWTSKAEIEPEVYLKSIEEVKTISQNMIANIVDRYNQLELKIEQNHSLKEPSTFKDYIDNTYNQYSKAEIVVLLNDKLSVINSSKIPNELNVDEKTEHIKELANKYESNHIAYVEKNNNIHEIKNWEVPEQATQIESQIQNVTNLKLVDYLNVTNNGIHSYRMTELKQEKQEKTNLAQLIDKAEKNKDTSQLENRVKDKNIEKER